MATSNGGGGGGEDQNNQMAELSKTLKEGERILAPTRRPDGSLRKPIRIRAGYVPQEEVAIYQSKGALWKKEMAAQVVPPGYDPESDVKPKTKAAKRNERKKEKRLQAALEKGKNPDVGEDEELEVEKEQPNLETNKTSEFVDSLTSQISELAVSSSPATVNPPLGETTDMGSHAQDIDKKIRALKKKIRLAEAQQQKTPSHNMTPEQREKMGKLEGWREELKLLEDKKAALEVS